MQTLGTTENPARLGHALLVTYQNASNTTSYWSTNLGLLTKQTVENALRGCSVDTTMKGVLKVTDLSRSTT